MTAAAPPRPAVMGPYKPDWMEKPSADDLSAYYPAEAARRDISGKATIVCKVMPEGRLAECQVKSESPPGQHFGEAALKLSSKFRMIPPDDMTAAPKTVTVPIIFALPKSGATTAQGAPSTDAQIALWIGAGAAAFATVLLVGMVWALGRYHQRAAKRSGERL